jgi:2-oxoacid:acceptor oxidoreductase delta subunit (pyruvate/2-ketoisovalerate family)
LPFRALLHLFPYSLADALDRRLHLRRQLGAGAELATLDPIDDGVPRKAPEGPRQLDCLGEPAEAPRVATGSWRTGVKPAARIDECVNCLLCWLYCPDSAILLNGTVFAGFDYEFCKGCELCAEVCPVEAVEMVPEASDLPEHGLIRGGRDGDVR